MGNLMSNSDGRLTSRPTLRYASDSNYLFGGTTCHGRYSCVRG
jgi:hypothetical protein